MSTADRGCVVQLVGAAGTGRCGWKREPRHRECAAHRRRMRVYDSYRAHIPVTRKPSRTPEAVAQRRELARRRADEAMAERARQDRSYAAQVAAKRAMTPTQRRAMAATV